MAECCWTLREIVLSVPALTKEWVVSRLETSLREAALLSGEGSD